MRFRQMALVRSFSLTYREIGGIIRYGISFASPNLSEEAQLLAEDS